MKANKPLKEAILRAPESTEENQQAQQEQLYNLGTHAKTTIPIQPLQDQPDIINESPRKRLQSLQNLRELEYEVEKKIKKE